jgi:addiction module HigA family antidote
MARMTIAADHPGKFLAQKLEALGVTPTELARQLHVPANRITQIVNGKRAITGDSALRLAHWFGNAPEFWMNLQTRYDLRLAAQDAGRAILSLPTGMASANRRRKRSPVANQKLITSPSTSASSALPVADHLGDTATVHRRGWRASR